MKPDFLTKKGTIALAAPSFGCTISPYFERLTRSIETLSKMKYKLILGDNIFKAFGIASSNTPELRAKEIMDLWHTDAKAIISVGGGEVMGDMLEYLDFEYIKNNPKWFCGYSDNTNLTFTLNTICEIESVYGSHAPQFHTRPFKYDSKDTLAMLEGKNEFVGYKSFEYHEPLPYDPNRVKEEIDPFEPRHLNKRTKAISYNYTKPVSGRIIGGCLDVLQTLVGTKFDNTVNYINKHKDEGIIFFMEACDFNSVGVKRAITQLKYAGWLDNVCMFLIGRSHNLNDKSFGLDIRDAYLEVLKGYNKPIILDAPIGHLGPSIPIRSGALATVSFIENNIKITYNE